jgi:hypothetical protein
MAPPYPFRWQESGRRQQLVVRIEVAGKRHKNAIEYPDSDGWMCSKQSGMDSRRIFAVDAPLNGSQNQGGVLRSERDAIADGVLN